MKHGRGVPVAAEGEGRRVLVVDDEPGLRRMLSDRLRAEGYRVDTAEDGGIAATMARAAAYDVIVLDLMLPYRDGIEVCRDLRRDGADTPVLMLTARDAVADKVRGLKAGADDYLTKPFECSELLARLEALLRRRTRAEPLEYRFGDVVVRPVAGQVLRDGRPVKISAQELKLLTHLVRHPGVLYSRDQLLDAVWGYQATPETRTVDVHVSWLRQKLEPDPHHPRHIVTVFGLGYRFEGGDADR
ncbi:MAG: response regulator transcription factor [Vicinamibacterales bacterium]